MFLDLLNEVVGESGDIIVLKSPVNIVQSPAQPAGLFHQMHVESLVGQRQCGGHAAQSTANDNTGLVHRERAAFEGPKRARPGDGHFDEFNCLFGGGLRYCGMHPGALVPDVGHFEQIRVQTRFPQGFAEQRLVRSRGAGGDHDAIEPVFMDHVLDVGQAGVGTGEHGVGRQNHVRLMLDAFDHRLDVHDRADVHAAVTDKDAEPRFFIGNVMLGGITLLGYQRVACRRQQFHGHGRRGAGLGDGLGNVLGFRRRAADEYAGPGGGQRQEPVGVAEAELVELDVQTGGQFRQAVRRFHAHGQDDQVEILLLQPAVFIEERNAQVLAAGHLDNPGRNALEVMDVLLGPGALIILVEILAVGADVHVENRRVQSLDVVAGDHGLFRRHHAADGGTIFVAARRIARTHALNPADAFGLAAVGQADDMTFERAGRGKHPFKLDAGDDIGIAAITEFTFAPGIELLETRGQDDRTHLERDRPLAHGVVNGVLLAGFDAPVAFRAQGAIQATRGLREGLLLGESFFNLVEISQPAGRSQFFGVGPGLFLQLVERGHERLWNRAEGILEPAAQ